ncbi:hypothetical protein GEMRC1_005637 [Eukaryota sp. GEM-RC1]
MFGEPLLKKSRYSYLLDDNNGRFEAFSKPLTKPCSTPQRTLYSTPVLLQRSLLVLIGSHSLRRFMRSCSDATLFCTSYQKSSFQKPMYTFFERFGFASQHLFKVSFLGAKLFFETNTFSLSSSSLPSVSAIAAFFHAKIRSIHLSESKSLNSYIILPYTHFISKLSTKTSTVKVLDLLNESSSIFLPQLKELSVDFSTDDSFSSFLEL